MRTIKFRAWFPEDHWYTGKNRMLYDYTNLNIFETYGFWSGDEIVYMQFTGLTDKNGKEIYEGDILRNELGRMCEIYWHEKSGLWDSKALNSEGRPMHFMERQFSLLEIIGNIHENPELL